MSFDFGPMNSAIFDQLADACSVQRGTDPAMDSRCIVQKGVERIGQHGQVLGLVTTVSFIKTEWTPARADVVTLSGVARKVEAIVSDDGYVVEAALHG